MTDAPTLTTLITFGFSIVAGAVLLVLAVAFGLAGRLLADVVIGAVMAVLLMLSYPPAPDTPDWIRLVIWLLASCLSHFAPRYMTSESGSAMPPHQAQAVDQVYMSEVAAIEELFDFEEVIDGTSTSWHPRRGAERGTDCQLPGFRSVWRDHQRTGAKPGDRDYRRH